MKNKTDLYEAANEMAEMIGTKELLDNLMMSLDVDDLASSLEYINRMFDLEVEGLE